MKSFDVRPSRGPRGIGPQCGPYGEMRVSFVTPSPPAMARFHPPSVAGRAGRSLRRRG